MARVTDSEVKEIISLNKLTDTSTFIDIANEIVTTELANSGLGSDRLKNIELYLSAHLVALHPDERQLTEQKIGEATDKFAGAFSDQLRFTQFGQMALLLDTSGSLEGIGGETCEIESIVPSYE